MSLRARMYTPCVCKCLQRPAEGAGCPRAGVTVVSQPTWVLGSEPGFSQRAASTALTHWSISPDHWDKMSLNTERQQSPETFCAERILLGLKNSHSSVLRGFLWWPAYDLCSATSLCVYSRCHSDRPEFVLPLRWGSSPQC